ncbi:glycosyltransferase family 4 protein [Chloroflexota bacterium]
MMKPTAWWRNSSLPTLNLLKKKDHRRRNRKKALGDKVTTMKIALVSPYDFGYPGGVVNHISCLEKSLTQMGHEVKIIAPASKAVHTFGDRFIRIGTPRPVPGSGSIARITLSPWLASRIKSVLAQEEFDICHLHEPLMPMLCTTMLRLSNVPTVGTFHASGGKPWYSFGTPLGKLLLKKWVNKLDAKIAVSSVARDYVKRHFPGEYIIIPNGIDTAHFNPDVTPIAELSDGKINIVFVGRMEKRKGLDYLLDAYKLVKNRVPDSRLIAVGPGVRLRKKYGRRISRNCLKDDVTFVGYASYTNLPRYYKTADIVCSPATGRESFGIVLLEAMAVSKPIVASNIEGYASVLSHNSEGLLVPPRNVEELAEAMITLISDKALREKMGAEGRNKALKYDWKRVAKMVEAVYLDVLNKGLPRGKSVETHATPV